MGFSHEKTTHHFELPSDGGTIEVRADDVKDTASREEIRSHFRRIAQMFAAGNFNVPMLVHSQEVPGTATMTALKNQTTLEPGRNSAVRAINMVADNKPALLAVHEFLRFQIADHKTGDCTAVR